MATTLNITASFISRSGILLLIILGITGCGSISGNSSEAVKPRYHHTWYKKHVYKKKWHIGRIRIRPEKQGVRHVKLRN